MKRLLFASILVLVLAATAASGAGITVFKTSFSSRGDYKSIRGLSGKGKDCKRDWRGKSAVGVTVKGGPADCALSTPVQGDSGQPDQIVRAVAKVNKGTDKRIRDSVYVGVVVRASRKENYELRVFPKARRYQLLKSGEVLETDRSREIEGLSKKNRLELEAIGSNVTAKVNRKEVASFKDRNSEQVGGRMTGISYGNRKDSKRGEGVGLFDKLKVQVPVP